MSEPFTDCVIEERTIRLEIREREKLAHIHIRFREWVYKFGDFRAAASAEASLWSCHTSGRWERCLKARAQPPLHPETRSLSSLSLWFPTRTTAAAAFWNVALPFSSTTAQFLPPSSPAPSSPSTTVSAIQPPVSPRSPPSLV